MGHSRLTVYLRTVLRVFHRLLKCGLLYANVVWYNQYNITIVCLLLAVL